MSDLRREKKEEGKESYFSKLKFEPKEFGLFSRGYLNNVRIVILFIILLTVGGIFSFITVPRNLNPEVEIPVIFISTALPGASSEDIENLLTIPIENKIKGLDGIDTLISTSTEGRSGVTVQFESNVDLQDAEIDVQTAVDSIGSLPENATDPQVSSLDLENQPIWTFSLVSKVDEVSLNRFAQELKDDLEDLSKIDRVSNRGLENQEVQVLIESEKAESIGLDYFALSRAVQNAVSSQPAGSVEASKKTFSLTIDPQIVKVQDLRDIRINVSGNVYLLSEVATIVERPAPGQASAYLIEGLGDSRTAITFDVYRNLSERIDLSFEDAKSLVDAKISQQDGRFEVRDIYSTAEEIEKQFGSLFRNFSVTMGLVFLVLLLFFGIRQALIASMAIPFSFLFSFIAMQLSGISLNFLSMFSLLISLGLLVDVTIVITSAVTSYYKEGRFTPTEAGLLVWKDFRVTLLVTTMTTVWAFSPLLLASGIIGEFIKPIPIVVSATLIGSLVVGLFITLPLIMASLKLEVPRRVRVLFSAILLLVVILLAIYFFRENPLAPLIAIVGLLFLLVTYFVRGELLEKVRKFFDKDSFKRNFNKFYNGIRNGVISFRFIARHYRVIIEKIISSKIARKKTLLAVVVFSLFSFMLIPAGLVVNEFFPKDDVDFFYVSVELPARTKLSVTEQEALILAEQLKRTSSMEAMQIQLGAKIGPDGSISSTSGFDSILYTVTLLPEEEREKSSVVIAEEVREKFANYNKGKISVVELSGGPPAGADVTMKFLGPEFSELHGFTDSVINYLEKQPGVTNITKSITTGSAKVVFEPDESKLAEMNISRSELGSMLRIFTNGLELDSDVRFSDLPEDRDIVLRSDKDIQQISDLGTVSPLGNNISIFSLGKFILRPNPSEIIREDGKRSLSVSASVREGYSATIINEELMSFVSSLSLLAEYEWRTGGANEENEESVQSILQAMILAFILILATLVIQLGSYRKALIVMLVIPLALSGVFIVFALTGTPLSFPALIGVLALFGIVVNNSIILVDKINLNLRSKMNLIDSISDAASSRLEPIALGSITTIIGLTPITLSDPLWRGLGGAIISGLIFSGVIMLFFIPTVYYSWFKEDEA